jgi:CRISPR/Cas system CSM-associated protein Csm5 (group 7 of RAMP superfamily)
MSKEEKYYLIDYLSSQASKYNNSERFLKNQKVNLEDFESYFKYKDLFKKINEKYL